MFYPDISCSLHFTMFSSIPFKNPIFNLFMKLIVVTLLLLALVFASEAIQHNRQKNAHRTYSGATRQNRHFFSRPYRTHKTDEYVDQVIEDNRRKIQEFNAINERMQKPVNGSANQSSGGVPFALSENPFLQFTADEFAAIFVSGFRETPPTEEELHRKAQIFERHGMQRPSKVAHNTLARHLLRKISQNHQNSQNDMQLHFHELNELHQQGHQSHTWTNPYSNSWDDFWGDANDDDWSDWSFSDLFDYKEKQDQKPVGPVAPSSKEPIAAKQPVVAPGKRIAPYPSSAVEVNWNLKNATTHIKNQKACGSCWTFAAIGAIESFYLIKGKGTMDLSQQQLVDCDTQSNGCNGGCQTTAYKFTIANGLVSEQKYPYAGKKQRCAQKTGPNKIAKYVRVSGRANIESALRKGVVSALVYVDAKEWQFLGKGVFNKCKKLQVNHAVVIVGFTKNQWIVRNSWGTGWGDHGHVKIAKEQNGGNACSIQDQIDTITA